MLMQVGNGGGVRVLRAKALLVKANISLIGVNSRLSSTQMRWKEPTSRFAVGRLFVHGGHGPRVEVANKIAVGQGENLGHLAECQIAAATNNDAFRHSSPRVPATSVGMGPENLAGKVLQDEAMPSSVGFAEQTRHLTTDAKILHQTFAELGLKPVQEVVGGVRTRQHVNPLKASLMAPPAPMDWDSLLADSSLPLMVDIGSGSGRLLMVLAKRNQGMQNYLGLDVRERLVNRANLWAEELNLHHSVKFLTANATVAFSALLATYPGPLELVSVLCPDPHFKRRHQKRKIVQKRLVDAILHHLRSPGGRIFVQSDVKEVAVDMREQFDMHLGSSLELTGLEQGIERDLEGWVINNPIGIPSEREAHIVANGGRVYRSLYQRL